MKDKILNGIKNNKCCILFGFCLTIFLVILINVLNGNISSFDENMYNAISLLKSNGTTVVFKLITWFGDAETLILITIICLIVIKNRKIGVSIAVNLASVALINHILKETIQRPRPPLEYRMVEETSFSFPSGHSMTGLAFYGLIIYFILRNVKNKKIKNISCISISLLILLIGISRIYLGVHYASDVLGGFLFSIAYLILYITFILKLFKV